MILFPSGPLSTFMVTAEAKVPPRIVKIIAHDSHVPGTILLLILKPPARSIFTN
jgi:hypothetical protein